MVMIRLYIIVLSLVAIILYGYDKVMAISNKWRISEQVLIGIGLAGGAWGALAGMVFFRHKIRHYRFWLILIPSGLFYLGLAVVEWKLSG